MEKSHFEQGKFWLKGATYTANSQDDTREKYSVAIAMVVQQAKLLSIMKMKVLLLTYQILHQLKNCMERQKKFPSLTTTTSSLILRKNRLYVRQDII